MLYGYAKVSSCDQNLNEEISALKNAGVEEANIFIDKDFNKSNYQALINTVFTDDMIIFKSINNLGRDYSEILEQWQYITKTKGVDVKILDMSLLDTSYYKDIMGTFISDLVLQILSFQAIHAKQRQAEGIATAKAKGVKFGRPRKPLPDNFDELYKRFLQNESIYKLAKECSEISESTLRLRLYERLKEERKR